MDARALLTRARRIVVKVGSNALRQDPELPERLAREMAGLAAAKRSFVLVSSGAIALGRRRLGYRTRPKEMSRLQAAAAAGQSVLMHTYERAFEGVGLTAAQVLLTHADLSDRARLNNARGALAALLDAGAVPIVNENDTVSTEEIAFGDNDRLAAMVVPLVGADALLLLTDVEGVLDAAGRRISVLGPDSRLGRPKNAAGPREGSGGIESKLRSARAASLSGAAVAIGPAGLNGVLEQILSGADVGTVIPAQGGALRARKHWIAFTLHPKGSVMVDEGAATALSAGRSSLLPVGVLGVRGDFRVGDAIRIESRDGSELARGLARLSASDVARGAGLKGTELAQRLGPTARDWVIVHRDDLVVTANGNAT